MNSSDFLSTAPGELVKTANQADAFIPAPLPSDIRLSTEVVSLLERATLAIGRLDQLGQSLVNPYLLIRPFIRREAVASSRMEGTTANLNELLLFERPRQQLRPTVMFAKSPITFARSSMGYGAQRVGRSAFPSSLRCISSC